MHARSMHVSELGAAGAYSPQWLAIYATLLSFVWNSLGSCMCGHLGRESLPGNLVIAAVAWNAFLRVPKHLPLTRVLVDALTVWLTLTLLKNVADVLWFGHGSMFGAMRRLTQEGAAHGVYWTGIAGCAIAVIALVVQYCRTRYSLVGS